MNTVIESARWVIFSVFMSALLVACGGGGSGSDSINAVRSVNVTVPNANSIATGDTRQVSASVTFDDGGTADVSDQVAYSTPPDGVISIDDSGLLTALTAGSTTLTTTFDGVSRTITINVAVARLESISITAAGLTTQNGQRRVFENATGVSFTARGTFSDGSTRDLPNARFTSNNDSALSFASATSGNATIGSVTADTPVTVTASQDDKSRTFSLTVLNDAITSIAIRTLNADGGAVVPAQTNRQLNAFATTTSGREVNVTTTAQWVITDTSVATVGNGATGGLVRGVTRGTTQLTATQDSISSPAATITVTATLVSIRITPDSDPVNSPAGIAQLFKAFGTFSDGAEERLSDVAWTLDNVAPAGQVSSTIVTTADANSGAEAGDLQVTGSQEGASADVIASRSGVSSDDNDAPVMFVTTAPLITAIEVSAPSTSGTNPATGNPTLPANRDDQYTATATFSDQTSGDVTTQVNWTSNNSGIAVVDNSTTKGLVSGIAAGSAVISAVATNPAGSAPATASDSITVEVTDADPTSINIEIVPGDSRTRVAVGFDLQFRATDGTTGRDVSNEVTWFTSVDQSIATIDQTGRLTAVSAATVENVSVQAQVDSNSVGDSLNITVEAATLFDIVVEPADSQLPIGETLQYTATGSFTTDTVIPGTTPTTAFSMDLSDQVTWSVLDPNAPNGPTDEATITQQGLATGVTAGDVQIQADCGANDMPQDECNDAFGQRNSGNTGLEVTDVVVRELFLSTITAVNGAVCQNPADANSSVMTEPECFASVARGLTIQLRARAVFSDGSVNENYQTSANISFSAVNADGSACTNVTVSNAAGSRGRVTGDELGNCQITAVASNPNTDADDAEMADRNVQITVTDEVLQQICIEPDEAGNSCANSTSVDTERAAGLAVQYRALGTFSDGSTRFLADGDQLSYSADPATGVVDVTASGLITGRTEGVGMTAQITATAQSVDGSLITSGASDFLVNAATLVSIDVTPETVSLPARTGDQLTATALFSDDTQTDVTSSNSTVWSSGNSAAVTVSNASGSQGRIFASGSSGDTAVITAAYTFNGGTPATDSSTVTVADGLVTAITVAPANATVAVGGSQQYTATAQRSDGSTDDISDQVTWSIVATGDGGAASITAAGNATGTAAGTVRVFARFTRSDNQRVSGNTQLTIANSPAP